MRFLETDWMYSYTKSSVSGTGSAQALPMSEEEIKAAGERRIPLGFQIAPGKKRRTRRKKNKA